MNWAREVALRIVEERPNEEIYTVASGVSPSGFVHIGNFREIATPYLVVKELIKLGKKGISINPTTKINIPIIK